MNVAVLRDFIYKLETGRTWPEAYNVIIGHNQSQLHKPLVQFSVDELLEAQLHWPKKFKLKSSAAGALQIIRPTLLEQKKELHLRGNEKFNPALQDKLFFALANKRGLKQFLNGQITVEQFGNNLAREWASVPLLMDTIREGKTVRRGQSYYDGDGINSAQTKPEEVEKMLRAVRSTIAVEELPRKETKPMRNWFNGFVTSTLFKYLVAMIATYIATKLGLESGAIEALLTQLVAVAMAAWGMWESSKDKVVIDGQKTELKTEHDKAVVAEVVETQVK